MKVQTDAFVALEYKLTLDSGEVVDESDPGETLDFIYGSGHIIPGLERQLEGMEQGQAAEIVVDAVEGYGPRDAELLHEVPRSRFPDDAEVEVGMMFQAQGPFGERPVRVAAVQKDAVTIDFNHPLAGERLHFSVKLAEVREATDADRKAVHAGCDHESCGNCGEGHVH